MKELFLEGNALCQLLSRERHEVYPFAIDT